jgi:hypothetical protein
MFICLMKESKEITYEKLQKSKIMIYNVKILD